MKILSFKNRHLVQENDDIDLSSFSSIIRHDETIHINPNKPTLRLLKTKQNLEDDLDAHDLSSFVTIIRNEQEIPINFDLPVVINRQGGNGIDGKTGKQGIQGFTGATGIGLIGATGVNGLRGSAGKSITGATGLTGATGKTGKNGLMGATGLGLIGATGMKGPKGSNGIGSKGATGPQGLVGATGLGIVGATGVTGFVGATGIAGYVGKDGATGLTGHVGATGIGKQGLVGATGIGVVGATGLEGKKGYIGATGIGKNGLTGATGLQGLVGLEGKAGLQGHIGATGIGLTGATGLVGATGEKGEDGLTPKYEYARGQLRFQKSEEEWGDWINLKQMVAKLAPAPTPMAAPMLLGGGGNPTEFYNGNQYVGETQNVVFDPASFIIAKAGKTMYVTSLGTSGGVTTIPQLNFKWFSENFMVPATNTYTFFLSYIPIDYTEQVTINGLVMAKDIDYTINSNNITINPNHRIRRNWIVHVKYAYIDEGIGITPIGKVKIA
jgi:hypothetical protein